MAILPAATAPVGYAIISKGTFFIALRFKRPVRILLSPIILGFGLLSTYTSPRIPNVLGIPGFWNLFVLVWLHHAFSVLLFENLELPAGTSKQLWYYAYRNYHNPRWNISCSKQHQTPMKETPAPNENLRFAMRRLAKLAFCWILQIYVFAPILSAHIQPTIDDFSPVNQTYFRRMLLASDSPITVRETQLRAFMAVYWIWYGYIMLDGAHIIFSIFFAAILRLEPVDDWPPLFGSLFEAYSLRRFWGNFWHRLASPSCGYTGKFVARRFLRLRPDSRGEKTFIAFWTFFVSAILHAASEWLAEEPAMPVEEIMFWLANFVAVALEMVVLGMVKQRLRKGGYRNTLWVLQSRFVSRVVGYAWVMLFFFWIAPKWQYPKVYKEINAMQNEQYAGEFNFAEWLAANSGQPFDDTIGGNATMAGWNIFAGM